MPAPTDQLALFSIDADSGAGPGLPEGCEYRPDFLNTAEETELLDFVSSLTLDSARYKSYTARRRVAHFGTDYDYEGNRLLSAPPLPDALHRLRGRAAAWIGVPPQALESALVAEYQPGVPLGWHRDVPDFETVFGVSLLGMARMRFRRYPPLHPRKEDVLALALAPRSAYVLRGEARWGWQHSIAPTPALRLSITLRTRRLPAPSADDSQPVCREPFPGVGPGRTQV